MNAAYFIEFVKIFMYYIIYSLCELCKPYHKKEKALASTTAGICIFSHGMKKNAHAINFHCVLFFILRKLRDWGGAGKFCLNLLIYTKKRPTFIALLIVIAHILTTKLYWLLFFLLCRKYWKTNRIHKNKFWDEKKKNREKTEYVYGQFPAPVTIR